MHFDYMIYSLDVVPFGRQMVTLTDLKRYYGTLWMAYQIKEKV